MAEYLLNLRRVKHSDEPKTRLSLRLISMTLKEGVKRYLPFFSCMFFSYNNIIL